MVVDSWDWGGGGGGEEGEGEGDKCCKDIEILYSQCDEIKIEGRCGEIKTEEYVNTSLGNCGSKMNISLAWCGEIKITHNWTRSSLWLKSAGKSSN